MPTPKQLLMEHKYDGDLAADIKAMAAGGVSWREMAERVSARCGYEVSHESLRQWYREKDAA
jgi:intein-encoded DNA endonuclease-like protein